MDDEAGTGEERSGERAGDEREGPFCPRCGTHVDVMDLECPSCGLPLVGG